VDEYFLGRLAVALYMTYTFAGVMIVPAKRTNREEMMVEQLNLKIPHPVLVFLVFCGFVLPVAKELISNIFKNKGESFLPLLAISLAGVFAVWWLEGVSELFILIMLSGPVSILKEEADQRDSDAAARNRVLDAVYQRSLREYEADLAEEAAAGDGAADSVERVVQARPPPSKPRRHFLRRVWAFVAVGFLLCSPFIALTVMSNYDPEFVLRKDVRRHPALRVMKRFLGADRKPLDPWAVVGVDVGADDSKIRSTFRKKALKLHPDKNPNNREESQQQFELLQRSYDILVKKSARREFMKKTRMGELSQLVGRSTLLSTHLGMTLAGVLLEFLVKILLGLGALALASFTKLLRRGRGRGGASAERDELADGQLDAEKPFTKREQEEAAVSADKHFEITLHRPATLQLLTVAVERRETLQMLLKMYGKRLQPQVRPRLKKRLSEERSLVQSLEARLQGKAARHVQQAKEEHVLFLERFNRTSMEGMEHLGMGNLWNDQQTTLMASEARMAASAVTMIDIYKQREASVPEAVGQVQTEARRVFDKRREDLAEYNFNDPDMGLRMQNDLDSVMEGAMARSLATQMDAALERSEHREFMERSISFFCELGACQPPFKFPHRLPPAAKKKKAE